MPLVFLPVGVLETLAVFDSVNERSFPLDVLRPSCQINNEQRDSEEKTDDFHFVFTTQQQKEQDTNVSGLDGDHRCSRKRQVKQ